MSYLDDDAELIRSCLPDRDAVPDNADDLFLLYAVLMRAKGEETEASDVHDAWSAWMARTNPDHESIRPFEQLPASVQSEDTPFLVAIRAAALRRR